MTLPRTIRLVICKLRSSNVSVLDQITLCIYIITRKSLYPVHRFRMKKVIFCFRYVMSIMSYSQPHEHLLFPYISVLCVQKSTDNSPKTNKHEQEYCKLKAIVRRVRVLPLYLRRAYKKSSEDDNRNEDLSSLLPLHQRGGEEVSI